MSNTSVLNDDILRADSYNAIKVSAKLLHEHDATCTTFTKCSAHFLNFNSRINFQICLRLK